MYYSSMEFTMTSYNCIYGSFYASSSFGGIPGLSTPPVAYLSEFDYTSSWSGALDPISANVSAAASYIVSEYQSLEMFDANNVSMGVTFLADLRWSTPGGVETSASGDLSWVTFVGTKRNDPLVVSIDVVTSDVLGQLNWGAAITPRIMKTRVNVTNYPDAGDRLVLNMVVASSTVDATASVVVDGSDMSQIVRPTAEDSDEHGVYFEFASQAACDDGSCSVSISVLPGTEADFNSTDVWMQLDGQMSGGNFVEVQRVAISLPAAGVNSWLWDPSIGSGVPPMKPTKPSPISKEAGIALAISAVVLAALGFGYCKYRKAAREALGQPKAGALPSYQGLDAVDGSNATAHTQPATFQA